MTTPTQIASIQVVVRERQGVDGLVVQRLERYLDYSAKWTIEKAACVGNVSMLQRLGTRNADIQDCRFDWCMRVAANDGNLRVIQWLSAYCPKAPVSTRVMDAAAMRGHLEIVSWLHANRSEGCTVNAMNSAAASGHLHVVRWLHENRSEGCTTTAMDTAAAGGHLEVVEWLAEHRREGCTPTAVDFAIYNGHFPVVKWFSERAKAAKSGSTSDWLMKTQRKLITACQ